MINIVFTGDIDWSSMGVTKAQIQGTKIKVMEDMRLGELRLCKICLDKDRRVTLIPCGHFISCVECAQSLKECPVCRTNITSFQKTYLS